MLPTGGRKSLLFILATSLKDLGVTILVALFNALIKDYVKRLKLADINYVV